MITLGADPEFFIESQGRIVSSLDYMADGTKERPVSLGREGYMYQHDNIMGEYNVPATTNTGSFMDSITTGLSLCSELLRKRSDGTATISTLSEVMAPEAPLQDARTREFGCSPEFNAYGFEDSDAPAPPIDMRVLERDGGQMRFAGGHVHLGGDFKCPPHVVALLCDFFVGLRTLSMDSQPNRRHLYGKAGRYRPTPYGIEYRTLSNFWIHDENAAAEVAYGATTAATMAQGNVANLRTFFSVCPWKSVQTAINHEDTALASQIQSEVRRKTRGLW